MFSISCPDKSIMQQKGFVFLDRYTGHPVVWLSYI